MLAHTQRTHHLLTTQKHAYFSSLPQPRLVSLLLHATIRHPELPLFPPNMHDQVPRATKPISTPQPAQHTPTPPTQPPMPAPTTAAATPHPITITTTTATPTATATAPTTATPARPSIDMAGNQYDEDDGYDTDPPAHYPKAGNGLARAMPPESEDLQWLVDENFDVFSHGWKGDGTGLGADGELETAPPS